MESPARSIRFIHRAILAEAEALEADAWAGRLDGWVDRATFLARVVHLHTTGEEVSFFAELAEKFPGWADGYLLDHVVEREQFDQAIGAARAGDLDATRRAISALLAHTRLHVRKEEEIVVPLVERLYTFAEIAAVTGRMMASFAPADMAAVVPWLVRRLTPADRVAYAGMMKGVLPPERLPIVAGWFAQGLDPAEYAAVRDAVPGF